MTDTKITQLRAVAGGEKGAASRLRTFVADKLMSEWDEDDVTLEAASPDERKIGTLNAVEREAYVIGQLLQQVLRIALVEIEANSTDKIAGIMRTRQVGMGEALQIFRDTSTEHLADEDQDFLNQCALTIGKSMTDYEWSLRERYNIWRGQLIVRSGYVAYTYG